MHRDGCAPVATGSLEGMTIGDRSGDMHVFLDRHGDDHIVTRFIINKAGQVHEIMLPHGVWAWDRAVMRAKRAAAFFETPDCETPDFETPDFETPDSAMPAC